MYQCGLAGIPGMVHRKKVWYLKQINEVSEILKQSQKVAEECNKYSISVTYDIATAKLAMPILAEEKPTYHNVFIHLGLFHITCAFFSMLGKYLAESGGPHILNETHVIEKGSLKSFLPGKSYKKKTFTKILLLKNLMKYLGSINSIQRKQKDCMEKRMVQFWFGYYIEILHLYHEHEFIRST